MKNSTSVVVADLASRVMDVTGMSAGGRLDREHACEYTHTQTHTHVPTREGVGPVTGVHAQPLLPLDSAMKPLESLFGQSPLATAVWFSKEHAQEHLHKVMGGR